MNGRQTTETTQNSATAIPATASECLNIKRKRRQYRQMVQKYQKIDDNNKYKILPKKLFLLQKNTSFYLFPLK